MQSINEGFRRGHGEDVDGVEVGDDKVSGISSTKNGLISRNKLHHVLKQKVYCEM